MHFQPHYFSPQQHALPSDLETRFSHVSIPGGPTSPGQPTAPPPAAPSSAAPPAMRPSQLQTPASISPASSTRPERRARSTSPVNTTSRPHSERPLVRRPYHPNPPAHRSEWVMWVGNVPDDTTHDELWRFLKHPHSPSSELSEPADSGVSSIFLISRSNCAFVNYDREESLQRAIAKFNGQQLHPHEWRCPRLVCRARRKEDDLRAGVGGQRGMGVHTRYVREQKKEKQETAPSEDELSSPVNRYSSLSSEAGRAPTVLSNDEETARISPSLQLGQCVRAPSGSSYASTNSSLLSRYFPKRFFILKSLTQFDLDLSVENGLWATQKHNETILDQAYRTSTEVILIFGVNKSGEFYGYARMAGRISQGEHRISWASHADSPSSPISSLSSRRQVKPSPPVSTSQAFFTPSENRLVEESPLPVTPSMGGLSSSKPSPAVPHQSSAPAALGPHQKREFSAGSPAPKFSLGAAGKAKSIAGLLSKDFASPAPSIELDTNAPVRAVRNKRSTEDTKTGVSALQPVQEENNSTSGDGDEEQVNENAKPTTAENAGNDGRQTWGQAFKVEWLCTDRLPFHRIRHLRNPWNHDREIKVSRDGTELEPGVGQQLVEQWQTLAATPTTVETNKPAPAVSERPVKSTPALSSTVGKSRG
ncbi:hypothetical protein K503DRAFT_701659 [Rhizopogon vinicolor AM-OR11-026]|uniref:YTH domain-containing protein n=1 Tax=Rhizopogon vinicolor AM-OR11-026 TaxID=1314800 RepID=A0A1B7MJA4_9AGAM|nr:hypothetical protein K503DRAFT_701659 [Rhizopogon vinicolor AM-OR11-026]